MSDNSSGGSERVMVDIETLGLDPGAAILSIGAVRFGPGGLGEEFEINIDLKSCQDAGLDIDAGTLKWWLSQDGEAQHVLTGGMRLGKALWRFSEFYRPADEIWAYSPSFDCEMLKEAYDAAGMSPPWTYKDERDCRTLAALPIWPDFEQEGVEHDALDDAKYQARQTAETLRSLHTRSDRDER